MTVPRWHWGDDPATLTAVLERGGVLAIPTESSYGLAVSPHSEAGVQAIFRTKARPAGEPLPVVLDDVSRAPGLGVDPSDRGLVRATPHWPAALSVVVDLSRPLPASAGVATLAIRIPGHARLRHLLERLGTPLTATSANRSGEAPIVDPDELAVLLAGTDAAIVDDGRLAGGPPSTLVRWNLGSGAFDVLRNGAFPARLLADP